MARIIKIDVDGVIRDMLGALCKLYYPFDHYISREDICHYSVNVSFPAIREQLGVEAHDYFFKHHSEDVNFNMAVPLNGAKEAIDKLHEFGYKIVIVTKQQNTSSKITTLDFLRHYRIYYDDICFTGDKWLVESDFMIDDNPEFLQDRKEKTDKNNRFIIDAPYNKECTEFKRFNSLLDCVQHIIRKNGFANEDKKDYNN